MNINRNQNLKNNTLFTPAITRISAAVGKEMRYSRSQKNFQNKQVKIILSSRSLRSEQAKLPTTQERKLKNRQAEMNTIRNQKLKK